MLATLINRLLKAKMHANTYFWNFLFLYSNTIWFIIIIIIIERLGRMHENKTFYFFIFLFFYFLMSWWKPSILILDLYLYNIKIQTGIDQNAVNFFAENHIFLKNNFWRI